MRDKVNSILTETDGGLQIFQYYISDTFIIKKAFKSPLREDKKPSFSIYKDPNSGNYLFKDFAQSDVKGDAIKFVQLKYRDTFLEAIQRIERDVINTTSNDWLVSLTNDLAVKGIDTPENDIAAIDYALYPSRFMAKTLLWSTTLKVAFKNL